MRVAPTPLYNIFTDVLMFFKQLSGADTSTNNLVYILVYLCNYFCIKIMSSSYICEITSLYIDHTYMHRLSVFAMIIPDTMLAEKVVKGGGQK